MISMKTIDARGIHYRAERSDKDLFNAEKMKY